MEKVDKFLNNKGYRDMTAIMFDEYGNMGTFTYVRKQDGVLIYPEKMTVRVGLDNGEVTGFQASDYVYEHREDRAVPKGKLSLQEARKMLNNEFKEDYSRKALIEDEFSKEVLCYEFGGNVNGSSYRIYINADNGSEVSVEEVRTPIK
ncbi:Sporulation protein YpeB [compost metagenome]